MPPNNNTQEASFVMLPVTISVKAENLSAVSLREMASILYKEEEYECAIEFFLQAAEKGDESAHIRVGDMFKEGKGVEKDCLKAEYLYKEAVDMGSISAKVCVAKLYEEGDGNIERDYDEARRWYLDAANDDSDEAAFRLGIVHEDAAGVKRNLSKACSWYEKAASLGSAEGAFNAGRLYGDGADGIAQDYKKAHLFYKQAVAENHSGALNNIGVLYHYGRGVALHYEQAREYYERSAELGCYVAKFNLGDLYGWRGDEASTKNLELSLKYYKEAKELGIKGCEEKIISVKKWMQESKK